MSLRSSSDAMRGTLMAVVLFAVGLAFIAMVSVPDERVEMVAFQPHWGKLTMMLDTQQRQVNSARNARTTQLSDLPVRRRNARNARQRASQMLHTGDSYAEESSRPSARSIARARYVNDHVGYTSDLRETPDRSAYDFASRISDQRDEREDWARPQQLAEVDEESRRPSSISRNRYRNNHIGYTSDVPEVRSSAEDNAYDFAGAISRQRDEREDARGVRRARKQQLDMMDDNNDRREEEEEQDHTAWNWADSNMPSLAASQEPAAAPARAPSSYGNTKKSPMGYTSAVPESRNGPEESAWGWASGQFLAKRQEREDAKFTNKAAAPFPQHVTEESMNKNLKTLRQRKIAAARRAAEDVHATTQKFEDIDFLRKIKEEALRVREIEEKHAAQERAADQGADAENRAYASVAREGLPDGAQSAMSVLEGTSGAQSGSSKQGGEATVDKAFEKGFNAGEKAVESKLEGVAESVMQVQAQLMRQRERAALKRAAKLKAQQSRLSDIARTQSLADDTWSADADFQVDGSSGAPLSGDWA